MRYIPLKDQIPDPTWVAKADDLLVQLKAAPDSAARKVIIDGHSALWGELKIWLLTLSHNKCWFSEAKDCFSHWDVEHYRPKKSAKNADGTEDEGYWWLAFSWQNFRICGNAGNRMKGTYFPLRPGSRRADDPTYDLRLEDPQLLDPIDEDDPNLLSFNVNGDVIPVAGLVNAWALERVNFSIQRYKLDFPPLADKRKVIWNECWGRLQTYIHELALYERDQTNPIARDKFKQAAKEVRQLMRADQELSAVARACVLSSGDDRVKGLLQSA